MANLTPNSNASTSWQCLGAKVLGCLFLAWALAAASAQEASSPALPSIDASMSGRQIFDAVCAACHGPEGEGKKELLTPSIAGQPDWFIALQLEKFRIGHRGAGDKSDATGQLMLAVAQALPKEKIPGVAEHVASLDPVPTTTEMKGDALRGEELFMETCAACHRYNGQGEKVFRSAPLTALPDWYIAASIRKFQEGVRGYQHGDLDGPKMREIAERIGEDQIADLIVHIANLAEKYPPGETTRRGPRKVPEFGTDDADE